MAFPQSVDIAACRRCTILSNFGHSVRMADCRQPARCYARFSYRTAGNARASVRRISDNQLCDKKIKIFIHAYSLADRIARSRCIGDSRRCCFRLVHAAMADTILRYMRVNFWFVPRFRCSAHHHWFGDGCNSKHRCCGEASAYHNCSARLRIHCRLRTDCIFRRFDRISVARHCVVDYGRNAVGRRFAVHLD